MTTAPRSQVSGHYSGPVTRLLAFATDGLIVTAVFSLTVGGIELVARLVLGTSPVSGERSGWMWFAAYASLAFLYSVVSLAIAGRTPGKALVGLRVVARSGEPVTPRQAVVRTICLPLSFAIFGLGLVGIIIGREHRALHDVLGGTAVVYDWGDRPAELPTPLSRYLVRRGALAEASASAPPDPGPVSAAPGR